MTWLTVMDHRGASFDLKALKGRPHAYVFLPGAFTPVCTQEVKALNEIYVKFIDLETPVFAVTCDAPIVLAAWKEVNGLDLPLLSDFWPHGALASRHSAFDDISGRCRRVTVVRDAEGVTVYREQSDLSDARDMQKLAKVLEDL